VSDGAPVLPRRRLSQAPSQNRIEAAATEMPRPGTIYPGDCVEVMGKWRSAIF